MTKQQIINQIIQKYWLRDFGTKLSVIVAYRSELEDLEKLYPNNLLLQNVYESRSSNTVTGSFIFMD